jgi:hypothetical protein
MNYKLVKKVKASCRMLITRLNALSVDFGVIVTVSIEELSLLAESLEMALR